MRFAKHQAGMGFIGWLFTLAVAGVFGILLLKLIPAYIEYFNIRSVLQSFKANAGTYTSAEEIRQSIGKRFRINDITSVSPTDVLIVPRGSGYSLELEYEKRIPFMFNLSLVVDFSQKGSVQGGGLPD